MRHRKLLGFGIELAYNPGKLSIENDPYSTDIDTHKKGVIAEYRQERKGRSMMNKPMAEALEKHLNPLEREKRHSKRVFAGVLIIGMSIVLCASGSAGPSEKAVVPKFKNVDEAIGWLKAKGNCEKIGKEQQGWRCKIRLDLPDERLPEAKGESIWQVWAWMESFDLEFHRNFNVNIVRSKNFLLLANDPKTTVRSVRVSNYYFDKSGKVSEASIDIDLENFKGEKILRQSIPIPLGSIHKHGDGAGDMILLMEHLGIGWKY